MNRVFAHLDAGTIAYFSMDVAIDSGIPTYSGGLGILAGDTLRSAADLEALMVAVTLLHRKGYFEQRLDSKGNHLETPSKWSPENRLEPLSPQVTISIEGRNVGVRAWRYLFGGVSGHGVPLFFLDTNLDENDPRDRALTDHLYGGDELYRLCQEVVLGFGGVAMLRTLGYTNLRVFHMNEGHSALITLALLQEQAGAKLDGGFSETQVETVRRQCVFTTHTPVPAGHDRFRADLVRQVLGEAFAAALRQMRVMDGELNMTELALRLSGFVNGVSMRHGEVTRAMFPDYNIKAITNGVDAATWAADPFAALYDRRIPQWRRDNGYLRYAVGIPVAEIRQAHRQAKQALLQQVRWRTGSQLDEKVFTVGFARRATAYKRADLLFSDLERLKQIAREAGPLQLVYAGKAHPRDQAGKAIIRRIFEAAAALANYVRVVYLENHDMALGKLLCAGVDVWLNTPRRPQEASGTSGMKAAMNGGLNCSILDGWWCEAYSPEVGFAIGGDKAADDAADAAALFDVFEREVVPAYYERDERGLPVRWLELMRGSIELLGARFNTNRMVREYVETMYLPAHRAHEQPARALA